MEQHRAPDGSRIGDRPLVMGVVNVTPDSFSDGGRHMGASAIEHARALRGRYSRSSGHHRYPAGPSRETE